MNSQIHTISVLYPNPGLWFGFEMQKTASSVKELRNEVPFIVLGIKLVKYYTMLVSTVQYFCLEEWHPLNYLPFLK
jgi:hypothetical protein